MLSAKDDLLHDPGTERLFTETNWFGFINVEQEEVSFGVYVGFKPNLGLCYSWIAAFRGFHPHHASIEYFDRRQFMPVPTVTESGYELDNGLRVEFVEPLEKFHITYSDTARNFAIDVEWSAICPPSEWAKSGHFDHFGHVTGTLTLDGRTYPVDTFAQRDHSWSVRGDESLPAVPPKPFAWVWGAFSENFAFQSAANWTLTTDAGGSDTHSGTPVHAGGGEQASWLWDGDNIDYTTEVNFEITKWEGSLRPTAARIAFRTESGKSYSFDGKVVSAALIPNSFNFSTLVCQVHWRDEDGNAGIGDFHLSITPANYTGAGA